MANKLLNWVVQSPDFTRFWAVPSFSVSGLGALIEDQDEQAI